MIEPFVVRGYEPQTFYQPKREKMMKDKNIENELNLAFSKSFDGFYPTLNTELLTLLWEDIKKPSKSRLDANFKALTEDEFISIIKEYGSVSHFISVSGFVDLSANFEDEEYDIPAEKIEEFGVDKIQSWRNFDNIEKIVGIDSWDEGQRFIDEDNMGVGIIGSPPELSEVKVFTEVNFFIPTLNVFAEKEVNL